MTTKINYEAGATAVVDAQRTADGLRDRVGDRYAMDGAESADFLATDAASVLPDYLLAAMDSCDDNVKAAIVGRLTSGIKQYEAQHNRTMPPDVFNQAMHNAAAAFDSASYGGSAGSTLSSGASAFAPAQAIVSIDSTLANACPFAHYATSNGSSEVPIALLSRSAASTTGKYQKGDSLDGISGGQVYMGSQRAHTVYTEAPAEGAANSTISGYINSQVTATDMCKQSEGTPLVKGAGVVYYNGRPVAEEGAKSSTDTSTLSGVFDMDGTEVTISGSVNTATGLFTITATPALPQGTAFVFDTSIKYEGNDNLIPGFAMDAVIESVVARDWKAKSEITRESLEKMTRELNVSPASELTVGIQGQFTNERHYNMLNRAMRLATSNQYSFDLGYSNRAVNMNVSQMFRDMMAVIDEASQDMVESTNSHGISFIYVGKALARFFNSLPSEMFQKSGLARKPGIFRLGTLAGTIEVYYAPGLFTEIGTTGQMLCLGRGSDVARSAFVMGDVVPPLLQDADGGVAMAERASFYAKVFNTLNPHAITWGSAAMIDVTDTPAVASASSTPFFGTIEQA